MKIFYNLFSNNHNKGFLNMLIIFCIYMYCIFIQLFIVLPLQSSGDIQGSLHNYYKIPNLLHFMTGKLLIGHFSQLKLFPIGWVQNLFPNGWKKNAS